MKRTGYLISAALPDNPLEHIQIDIPSADDCDHLFSLEAICVFEETADGEGPRTLYALRREDPHHHHFQAHKDRAAFQ